MLRIAFAWLVLWRYPELSYELMQRQGQQRVGGFL